MKVLNPTIEMKKSKANKYTFLSLGASGIMRSSGEYLSMHESVNRLPRFKAREY